MASDLTAGLDKSYVHEYIVLSGITDPPSLECADCGARLCAWNENYREHAAVTDTPIEQLGGLFGTFADTLDEAIVYRAYDCPACGRRLDAEVCPESADHLWDLRLADPAAVLARDAAGAAT